MRFFEICLKQNTGMRLKPIKFLITSICLFAFYFCAAQQVKAAQPIVIQESSEKHVLGTYIDILEDETKTLAISDVSSLPVSTSFTPSTQETPTFGWRSSAFWVRFTLDNQSSMEMERYLEINYPLLDYVELYMPDAAGQFSVVKGGDYLPFDTREIKYRNLVFPLRQEPQSVRTYYMRVESTGSMNLPLILWSKTALIKMMNDEQFLLGIYYGTIFVMVIFNFIVFTSVKDKTYLYFVLYLIGWGIGMMQINGLAFQYLWGNSIWWANNSLVSFLFFTCLAMNQFGRVYLNTKENAPVLDKILLGFIIADSVGITLPLFASYQWGIRLGSAIVILNVLFLLLAGLAVLRQKYHPAYYFLTACTTFFLGVAMFALKSFGTLSSNFITDWGIQIGAFLVVVLFSLGLGARLNTIRKEQYQAEADRQAAQAEAETARLKAETAEAQARAIEVENERRMQELEEARQLQLSMLPKFVPQLPNVEVAAYMKPATEVGGDYYDFHVSSDGTLTVAVGDATGHGLKAGSIVTAAKGLFNAFAVEENIPQIFNKTSMALKKMNLRGLFMSMTILKVKDNRLTLSSAGMPSTLIYRAASQKVEEISIRAVPLGSISGSVYQQQKTNIETGDVIFTMTDGFPEMFNEQDEMLGYEKAEIFLQENADLSAQEIINRFVQIGERWAGTRPLADDVTFVVIKMI
jgi:serine phosphatase RsbU (regulator of sigma subunit)